MSEIVSSDKRRLSADKVSAEHVGDMVNVMVTEMLTDASVNPNSIDVRVMRHMGGHSIEVNARKRERAL